MIGLADLFLFGLIVVAAACAWGLAGRFVRWLDRIPVKDLDGSRKTLTDAQARPEEAERPALPQQIIVHLSVGDRIGDRATPEEMKAFQKACVMVERSQVARWN